MMNFDQVLFSFRTPSILTVYDTTGAYVDGFWQEGELVKREQSISAIVLAMSTPELEFYKEGDSSASGITLHTKADLFWTDVNNADEAGQPGQECRQSYVDCYGFRFRVAGSGFIKGNTNFNIYNCVRYIR